MKMKVVQIALHCVLRVCARRTSIKEEKNTDKKMASLVPDKLHISPDSSLDMDLCLDPTPIQSFYANKNVFITGATGFMGKILLEKLLFSCPDIGGIYITARNKKGVSLESRVDDLFNNVIFDRVKKLRPDYRSKIKVLAGEFSLPNLGMSYEDRQVLIDEINIVFHVAATVKFNEPLTNALLLNVLATKNMLEIAKKMKNLKAFLHVSTAFCHPYRKTFDEKFYDVPYDPEALLKLAESTRIEDFEKLTPQLLKDWPNTYTYTKALAEEYIRKYGVGLPIGIFRPTIVVSSIKEPVPCWCDNWYGVTGYIAGCGVGFLRTLQAKKNCYVPIVPVDMSINGMICATWEISEKYENFQSSIHQSKLTSSDITIYNNTSMDNRITWYEFYDLVKSHGKKNPLTTAIWYPMSVFNENKIKHQFMKVALHWIPAYIVDGLRRIVGKKPELVSVYRRFEKFEGAICYFITRNWDFEDRNMARLVSKMTDRDQEIFFCDLNKIDWDDYLTDYFLGIRRYLLKEEDSSIPSAKKKYIRFYIYHTMIKLLLGIVIARYSYKVLFFLLRLLLSLQTRFQIPIANN